MDRKALPPKADCSLPGLLSSFHCKQIKKTCCCCLVAKSCPTLQPHGPQHTRLPCLSLSPGVCSNSCPSNHLILCRSLLLPSIFPSIRVFSKELVLCIRWPKYWSFSISLSNEYSGLISFRIDWFDLFAVQGTLKSLLQHHSSCTNLPKKHIDIVFV